MIIREIKEADNATVAFIIQSTLESFGAKGEGYAWADPEVHAMYEHFQGAGMSFYVVEDEAGDVLGCGGYAPLLSCTEICELQKMYFLPSLRGKGYGKKLIEHCLEGARKEGYYKCYLETLPQMQAARGLYEKFGFQYLEERISGTGHSKCNVWMIRDI